MDIEEVAARTPEKIHKVFIDPVAGLTATHADDIARKIGITGASHSRSPDVFAGFVPGF